MKKIYVSSSTFSSTTLVSFFGVSPTSDANKSSTSFLVVTGVGDDFYLHRRKKKLIKNQKPNSDYSISSLIKIFSKLIMNSERLIKMKDLNKIKIKNQIVAFPFIPIHFHIA